MSRDPSGGDDRDPRPAGPAGMAAGPPWPRRPAAEPGVLTFRCRGLVFMVSVTEYARRLGRPASDVWGVLQWGVAVGNMRARPDGSYDYVEPPEPAPGQP